ncbi:hypothetical protein ACFYKX_12810 [Cytobacillus sp. FJAT-54145]|uniref:YtxH domain-containing protein n=1 Tax=Cytobacillus spartinae TaxID=3299023 RepID=A0ABW6KFJ4_9BACI
MEETRVQENNHFLKGLIVGGIIGGSILLMDKRYRSKLTKSAKELTKVTKEKVQDISSNQDDIKKQAVEQFKIASSKLQEVIQETKNTTGNGLVYLMERAKPESAAGQATESSDKELEDSALNAQKN